MSDHSTLIALPVIACCFIGCHFATDDISGTSAGGSMSAAGAAPSMLGDGGNADGGASAGAGHDAGRPPAHGDAGSGGDAQGEAGAAGNAGAAVVTVGGASTGGGVGEVLEIAGDGGAPASECEGQRASCAIVKEPDCEFSQSAGVSATLDCGQVLTVGTANCGGCGVVEIQEYFDGQYCWQGMPECPLLNFAGKFLYPHLP